MDVNALLIRVMEEARRSGIPIAKRISPAVGLNRRAVARFGCCVKRGEIYYIEVSTRLLEAGEGAVRETLAHEVLHTCWGCRDHGLRWKGYAARMNADHGYHISRTGTWEAMGLDNPRPANYLLVCRRCGAEITRVRASQLVRHPERYRCRCGGELERKEALCVGA